MKALVVGNCNTTGYFNYLKAIYPDWDVRSVIHTQASAWLDAGNEAFVNFLSQVDVFVGMRQFFRKLPEDTLKRDVITLILPSFMYMGTRPDCFWFHGVKSPLGDGVIHSRVATAAYFLGKSVKDTLLLFNSDHFERIGYFSQYSKSRADLLASYRAAGIDIANAFDSWCDLGDFLHTPNHPDSRVFFDILHIGITNAGLSTALSADEVIAVREGFDDYLGKGIIWPIYPEVADRLGVANPKRLWRTSDARGQGVTFELEEMLHRSFALFDSIPDFRSLAADALGGGDTLALLGNH